MASSAMASSRWSVVLLCSASSGCKAWYTTNTSSSLPCRKSRSTRVRLAEVMVAEGWRCWALTTPSPHRARAAGAEERTWQSW